ncbi:MAG: hypothetical protein KAW12_11305 [Candidatus Aminicenantes bacterium]|nr:hypothetical protein [Candidatus Aminicenantes bacterium]
MKKKRVIILCSFVLVLTLLTGFFVFNLSAATCTTGDGDVCTGECCKLTKKGCQAGPCSVILK